MAKRNERTVLFLCTGNYYRSRFAEVLFNSVAGRMGLPWRASSRGLALERGINNVGPMAVSAIKALEAMGARADDAITRMPAQVTTGSSPGFHLEGVEAGRRVKVFRIDVDKGERLGLMATATVGEGGWVDLQEPIIVRAGEAFIAVPETVG